jgi:hypothetical protein
MGAISSLNLAENNLGELVLPEGWQRTGRHEWTHSDGAKVTENPGKPEGVIAIANALPDMGAMTGLNLSGNVLGVEGAKHLAAGIKVSKCVCGHWSFWLLAPFSYPSEHWLNCCCLLLSTG